MTVLDVPAACRANAIAAALARRSAASIGWMPGSAIAAAARLRAGAAAVAEGASAEGPAVVLNA